MYKRLKDYEDICFDKCMHNIINNYILYEIIYQEICYK